MCQAAVVRVEPFITFETCYGLGRTPRMLIAKSTSYLALPALSFWPKVR